MLLTVKGRDAAHGKRPESAGIADRKDAIVAHHDKGKSSLDAPKSVGHRLRQRLLLGERDQVNYHFGVAVGLKNRALAFETGAEWSGVHKVSIVRHGDRSLVRLHKDGLSIQQSGVASSRIAGMADRQ